MQILTPKVFRIQAPQNLSPQNVLKTGYKPRGDFRDFTVFVENINPGIVRGLNSFRRF